MDSSRRIRISVFATCFHHRMRQPKFSSLTLLDSRRSTGHIPSCCSPLCSLHDWNTFTAQFVALYVFLGTYMYPLQIIFICEEEHGLGNLPMEDSVLECLGGGSIQEQDSYSLWKGSPKQKAFSHIGLQNSSIHNTWHCHTTNHLKIGFFSDTGYSLGC